ncbi:unnamed protein product [Cylindrotheca closterium]|uniref:MYND-type domain-containing protein n=1 Tax=Cylindrotheca closterium TaxID=2856 RepID=A0AAD2CPM7_9STRA|nr:unnamed protein product [Cylindrotheca closterium]
MQATKRYTFEANLSDGRCVDIFTQAGADAYLEFGMSNAPMSLSGNVKDMSKLLSKRKLNAKDMGELEKMNAFSNGICSYASHDVFRQAMPASEIEVWLEFAIERINTFSTNHIYITTGKLANYDLSLLSTCLAMMLHPVPTALVFESQFFQALAGFVKARKGNGRALPCADICATVTLMVSNAYMATRAAFDNKWTSEKALKKLEATGVLEEFIRCATVPQPPHCCSPQLSLMIGEFQTCTPFLTKKLVKGQPCGDVVHAILEGRDGSRAERPNILNGLKTMVRFVESIDPVQKDAIDYRICRMCGKGDTSESFQQSLMKCARCQQAYYCSKSCQRADWKLHKKVCIPRTKFETKQSENLEQMLHTFCAQHYFRIMVKMAKACEQTGQHKSDMLVELDYCCNENGIVPAMKDEPEFKIAPVKEYLEGSKPAEPDWFGKKGSQEYNDNVKGYLHNLKDQYSKVLPSQFLFLVRYPEGTSTYKLQLIEPITKKQMFSQQAVRAFKTYMDHGDDGPLSRFLSPSYVVGVKRKLGIVYGYGMPDGEMSTQQAMDVLQSFGMDLHLNSTRF